MSQGEISRFYMAPELAYGDEGLEGKVPPGASLEYEIELLRVVDMDPDVDEFNEDIEIPKDLDKMGKNDLGEGGEWESRRKAVPGTSALPHQVSRRTAPEGSTQVIIWNKQHSS